MTHRTVSPAVTVAAAGSISATSTNGVAVPATNVTVCVPSVFASTFGGPTADSAPNAPLVSLLACAAAAAATPEGVLAVVPALTTLNDPAMPGWTRHTTLTLVPAGTFTFTKKCAVPVVGLAPEFRSAEPLYTQGFAALPHAPGAPLPTGGNVGAAIVGLNCN